MAWIAAAAAALRTTADCCANQLRPSLMGWQSSNWFAAVSLQLLLY
jgi:hypothetical protein